MHFSLPEIQASAGMTVSVGVISPESGRRGLSPIHPWRYLGATT
jgi:hypothetical protein